MKLLVVVVRLFGLGILHTAVLLSFGGNIILDAKRNDSWSGHLLDCCSCDDHVTAVGLQRASYIDLDAL